MNSLKVSAAQSWTIEGLYGHLLASYARKMPGHPCKLRLIKALARSLDTIACHPNGGRIRLETTDYLGWSLLNYGAFEPRSISLAIELMRDNEGAFVDVGANMGIYTIAVTSATRCRTVAIEPQPVNFARLTANLALNPDLNTSAFQCAATPGDTTVELIATPPGELAWTKIGQTNGFNGTRVKGRPLDSILSEAKVNSVALLKIDVEGYEPQALAGLNWNGPCRPRSVIMECSPGDTEKIEFMTRRGYSLMTVNRTSCVGLNDYPEGNVWFVSRS